MSPSTDRSSDPSPFAWIFGTALAAVAVAAVARTVMARRPGAPVAQAGPADDDAAEDPSLEGHPS